MDDRNRDEIPETVDTNGWTLCVRGAVERTLNLTRSDLESFPLETFTGDFACAEGWVKADLSWRGVRVGTILDRAGPTVSGEYALVHAMDGDYACSFPVGPLADSILALELDGDTLTPEQGGPARLVPTGTDRDCWESVKWVSEIEVVELPPTASNTAKERALSRIE